MAEEDPRLTRLLARFGRRGRLSWLPSRGWLLADLIGLLCLEMVFPLAVFARLPGASPRSRAGKGATGVVAARGRRSMLYQNLIMRSNAPLWPTMVGIGLGERLLGLFHVATGGWLKYLAYATTVDFTLGFHWRVRGTQRTD